MADPTSAPPDEHGRPNIPPNDPPRTGTAVQSPCATHYLVPSSGCVDRDARITVMHNKISGLVVGPVNGHDFLNRYMKQPAKVALDEQSIENFTVVMMGLQGIKVEEQMYKPWVVLRYILVCPTADSPSCSKVEVMQAMCPDLVVVDTHGCPAGGFDCKEVKPDASLYDATTYERGTGRIQDIKKSQMMVEFKVSEGGDPFDDNPWNPFERTDQTADETLGQITLYATAHAAAQYRTHIFSALVFPNYTRLMRRDRSGIVVTEKPPRDSDALYLFFRRFNYSTPDVRGIDTTVNTNPTLNRESESTIRRALNCESRGAAIFSRH